MRASSASLPSRLLLSALLCAFLPFSALSMRPIAARPPVLPNVTHPLQRSALWGPFQASTGGLPTNAFWTNFVLEEGTGNVAVHPYIVAAAAKENGLRVSYPRLVDGATCVMDAIEDDLVVGAREQMSSRFVAAFDELSVTLQMEDERDARVVFPLVRGSPFVSAQYTNAAPVFTSVHAILDVRGCTAGQICSTDTLRIEMDNGQVWMVFFEEALEVEWSTKAITVQEAYTGWVRAAVAVSPAVEEILPIYKRSIPVGGSVSYKVADDVVSIAFSWKIERSSNEALLMTSMPHHRDNIIGVSYEDAVVFNTLRGEMIGTVGDNWVLLERRTPINWSGPHPISSDKEGAVRAALNEDKSFNPGTGSDPYFGGKALAKLARLILIADELREDAWIEDMVHNLKESVDPWICGKNDNPLLFDSTYGGIVSTNGINDAGADFGNGWYNDHHFHYGYFLYAAAAIAKMDKDWLSQPAVGCNYPRHMFFQDMVRDIANPSLEDEAFPMFRYMDWFEGHSWAAGLSYFNDGKNQESTSEAVNGWYGMYLLGLAMEDPNVSDLGMALLMSELHSAKRYWHTHSTNAVYASVPTFSANKVVGILWGTKLDYTTWFGAAPEFIHCIQMLPITPIMEELLEEEWVQEQYPVLSEQMSEGITQDWLGFVYMDHAVIDKEKAWEEVNTLTLFDDGNSKTNTLYWVATRP